MAPRAATRRSGFTIVELLIVVAVLAVVLVLAAPSFRKMIEMQRLRSIAAQVVTDVQFARSEAPARQRRVYVSFTPSTTSGMTCYTIHTCLEGIDCQCLCDQGDNLRCPTSSKELRTVQLLSSGGVKVTPIAAEGAIVPNVLFFDPATGGMTAFEASLTLANQPAPGAASIETSLISGGASAPALRTVIATTGRPSVCAPGGRVTGVPSCQALP